MNKHDPNPLNLEKGKEYWLKYIPAKGSPWYKAKITHFTVNGHPWQVSSERSISGIVSPNMYDVRSITPETELVEKARVFLAKKGLSGFAHTTPLPDWFAEFYNEISPDYLIVEK